MQIGLHPLRLRHARDQIVGEFAAEHRPDLRSFARRRSETVEPGDERGAQRWRHAAGLPPRTGGGRQRRHVGQRLAAGTGFGHRSGQFLDKQRYAVGALDDRRRQCLGQLVVPDDALDHRGAAVRVEPSQDQCCDLRQPVPRRLEFRAEGQDQQYREVRRPLDDQIEQFPRTGVDPVHILYHHQHRLLAGEGVELMEQRGEQLFALALRGQTELGSTARQRQQVNDQRDLVAVMGARRDLGCELVELLRGRVIVREAGGAFELGDKRVERAILVMGRAAMTQEDMRLGV